MAMKYRTVVTTAGAAKFAAALTPGGKKVNITAMAVGDGGGKLPEPAASQTKLINEVWRGKLNRISQDNKHKNYIMAELIIPPQTGGFWLREMGLYDDTGTLVAVSNMAESYKPKLEEGSGRAQTLRMVIILSDLASVELSIDATTVLASQDYVDSKLLEHEQSRRHPDATLNAKGFTQLSSATDSISETLAATPKAVKAAYDLASTKYSALDATTARKGIIRLYSGTDSNTEELAATPKAVKAAYDLASTKYSALDATTARKGIIRLYSGTDSNTEELAATPKAVKAVNDNANSRVSRTGDNMTGQLKIGGVPDALRIYDASYGVIFRRSEDNFYLIPTAENQGEKGPIGQLRPFYLNMRSGQVSLGNGAIINGGLGLGTSNALGGNSICFGDNDTGIKQNGDGVLDVYANSGHVFRFQKGKVESKSPLTVTGDIDTNAEVRANGFCVNSYSGSWISMRDQKVMYGGSTVSNNSAQALLRQDHADRKFFLGGLGNAQFGMYMINNARTVNSTDGHAYLDTSGNWQCSAQMLPTSYANFDARYQLRGSYTPAGQAYTKAESNALFQSKNTAAKAVNGWFKDASTGMITQWGRYNSKAAGYSNLSFPIAFPSACVSISCTVDRTGMGAGDGNLSSVRSVSRTGFQAGTDLNGCYWIAIGY